MATPPNPVLVWATFAFDIVFGILVLAISFVVFRWTWGRRLRGVRLVADESGLRQTNGAPRSGGIRWHEARAFYQIEVRTAVRESVRHSLRELGLPADDDHFWLQQIVYALDSGEHLIVWALPKRASPAMLAARDRLHGIIAARTRLSLHDLTDQAAKMAEARMASRRHSRRKAPESTPASGGTNSPVTASSATPRLTRGKIAALAAPALLLALLYSVGGGLQVYQTQQTQQFAESALPRIHAETPLYYNAMSANDGVWPVHPASDTDGSFAFVNGSYQLTGGPEGAFLDAIAALTFGDAAVEVTIRQVGGTYDYLGAGLILRQHDNPSDEAEFFVNPDGTWGFARFDTTRNVDPYLVIGQSSKAIHTGPGAANRLLVLMRGPRYYCYINDQFVGVVYDEGLTEGHAGLVSQGNTAVSVFTDFAVYPAG